MDTDKRSFDLDGQAYYIKQPTAADIRDSDWNYSKVYSKSLVDGIYTSSEMRDILKKRGIIGPEYDKRAQELADTLESALTSMYTSSLDDKRKELAEEAERIRNEIFQWNHRLNGPMSNTCEQMADDAKLEFLTSRVIVSNNGELVWKDHDAFLNDSNPILPSRAKFEVMLYLQGLDSDFLDQVPEAIVLKDIKDKNDILEPAAGEIEVAMVNEVPGATKEVESKEETKEAKEETKEAKEETKEAKKKTKKRK
jgi:hypothetical protein